MPDILPCKIHVTFTASKYVGSSLAERYTYTASPKIDLGIRENYVAEIRLDGKAVQLALWDTAYVTSIYSTI